jgi:hypothetical protein
MKKPILLFLSLLPTIIFAQDTSISYGPIEEVNVAGEGGLRPRIVLNEAGHPVVLWGSHTPHGNYISRHDGSIFLGPTAVHVDGFEPAVGDWFGSGIAGIGNTLWLVMKGMPETTSPIYVRRSDDGGASWQDTIRVEPMNGLISDLPSIAVAEADAPIVMYMEFDPGWSNARQVISKMENGSFGMSTPVSTPFAAGDVCDCCPNQVVAESDRVVGLYRDAGNNERVIWGAWSNDGGSTYPYGAELDTTGWIAFACPSTGPDAMIDGDSLRYVWMSSATAGAKVYLASAHLSDQATIGHHGRIHSVAQNIVQNFPRIAGNGDTLGVVWEQMVLGVSQVLFSWSVTGPGGLSDPDTINVGLPGNHSAPDIEFRDGSFHIVWTDETNGQVRYRQAGVTNTTGIDSHPIDAFNIHPNPARERIFMDLEPRSQVEIFDATGRLVIPTTIETKGISVEALLPGTYMVRSGSLIARFQKQ